MPEPYILYHLNQRGSPHPCPVPYKLAQGNPMDGLYPAPSQWWLSFGRKTQKGALFSDRLSRCLPDLAGLTLTLRYVVPDYILPLPSRLKGCPALPPAWLIQVSTEESGIVNVIPSQSHKLRERLSRGARIAELFEQLQAHRLESELAAPPSSFPSFWVGFGHLLLLGGHVPPLRLVFKPDDSKYSSLQVTGKTDLPGRLPSVHPLMSLWMAFAWAFGCLWAVNGGSQVLRG